MKLLLQSFNLRLYPVYLTKVTYNYAVTNFINQDLRLKVTNNFRVIDFDTLLSLSDRFF